VPEIDSAVIPKNPGSPHIVQWGTTTRNVYGGWPFLFPVTRRLVSGFTLWIIAAIVAVPAAVSAVPIGTTDVLVFLVGEPSASIPLGGQATLVWIAYNSGTSPSFLAARPPTDGVLTFVASPLETILRPTESIEIRLEVEAPRYGAALSLTTYMTFEATELATGSTDTLSFLLEIAVLGVTEADNPQGKILGTFPNPLPAPLDNVWGAFALTVGFWLLAGATIVYVIAPLMKGIASKTKTRVDDIVLGIVRGPVFILIAFFGAVNSLGILGLPPEWRDLLRKGYGFAFIIILTWIAYRVFRNVLMTYGTELARRTATDVDDRPIPALEKLGTVVIVILGIVIAVQSLGYDITLFLAGLGVIGLIVAFAAQDTLSNFFAGIHLMLDRPFRKGDLIQLETGEVCEVRDVGLRSTKLYWGKVNVVLILPNNKIAGTKVVNFDRPNLPFRVHVTVGVSYDSDIEKVNRVLLGIADAKPDVLHDVGHAAAFQVDEFADSAVLVRLIFWVASPRDQWRVASEVREAILRRFREEGIEIPFPQRVLWTRERARIEAEPGA